jgi:tRNA threonylcarbamoyl adenosine modification protein YjeE
VSEAFRSSSAESTEAIGGSLAGRIRGGDVLLLEGDLAAGKTTLVRGLVRALGGNDAEVSSPSFILLQSYPCRSDAVVTVHHVDLYRLGEKIADLREIGIEEILSDAEAVVAVEWPKDAIATWIPTDARVWRLAITTEADDSRQIVVSAPDELKPLS